jgi:quercetin dioxygenase-like cupin family protein
MIAMRGSPTVGKPGLAAAAAGVPALENTEVKTLPVVLHADVTREPFNGGASYQTLVGDAQGSTPFRLGLQTSPPGYRTPLHSHPYMEALTVVSGEGEAWIEGHGGPIAMRPGVTLVMPAGVKHWFRALGREPLKTYGIHASPHRIVDIHEEAAGEGHRRA